MSRGSTYGISRVDNETSRTHGWLVTIQRRGVIYRKHFSDGVFGGKQRSFAAAKEYRDQIIAAHPPLSMQEYSNIVKKNNRSGVVGVCRYCASETRDLAGREAALALGGLMAAARRAAQAGEVLGQEVRRGRGFPDGDGCPRRGPGQAGGGFRSGRRAPQRCPAPRGTGGLPAPAGKAGVRQSLSARARLTSAGEHAVDPAHPRTRYRSPAPRSPSRGRTLPEHFQGIDHQREQAQGEEGDGQGDQHQQRTDDGVDEAQQHGADEG